MAALWYTLYMQTEHWKLLRDFALRRTGHSCEECGTHRRLAVHHKTYERLGRESPRDLKVLCKECHRDAHRHGRMREQSFIDQKEIPKFFHPKLRQELERQIAQWQARNSQATPRKRPIKTYDPVWAAGDVAFADSPVFHLYRRRKPADNPASNSII